MFVYRCADVCRVHSVESVFRSGQQLTMYLWKVCFLCSADCCHGDARSERRREWRALTSLWDPPPPLPSSNPPPPRPFPQEQRTLPGHEALLHFFLFFIRGGEEEEEAKPSLLLFKVVWTLTFWNVTHTGKLQLVVRHVVFFFSLLLYSKVRKLFLSKYNLVLLNFYGPMKHRGERTKPTWKYNVKFKTGNATGGEERLLNMNQITHTTKAHLCHNRKIKRDQYHITAWKYQCCKNVFSHYDKYFHITKKSVLCPNEKLFQDHTRLVFFKN